MWHAFHWHCMHVIKPGTCAYTCKNLNKIKIVYIGHFALSLKWSLLVSYRDGRFQMISKVLLLVNVLF